MSLSLDLGSLDGLQACSERTFVFSNQMDGKVVNVEDRDERQEF